MDTRIIEIQTPEASAAESLDIFFSLTEAQLRQGVAPNKKLFIAESPKVIEIALDKGLEPVSLLCEKRHISGDAAAIIERCGNIPIYTGEREVLSSITGYDLTRGVLCAMKRPQNNSPANICQDKKRIAVIDGVTNSTNVGAIFRCAAALGIEAVLLTPSTCDPLTRRSVRVSMGSVFLLPWAYFQDNTADFASNGIEMLHSLGFKTVAMALNKDNIPIDSPLLASQDRLAIILGTEGEGLSRSVTMRADFSALIPMSNNVDSLNVAAAAAVAFWQLAAKRF